MLRSRTKHTFKVEEILKAKVDLFGYPSPVHTHAKLVSMFKDAQLETKLQMQAKMDVRCTEDYAAKYEK